MQRAIFATIGGVIIGVIIVVVAETIGHLVFSPPEGTDLKDPEQLKAIMADIPIGAKIAVLIAWGLGTFGGGVSAVLMSARKSWPAGVVALVMLAAAGATLFAIPHPIWMVAGTLIVTAIAWLSATRFAAKP